MKLFKFLFSSSYFLLLSYAVFFAPRRRDRDYYHEINLVPVKYTVRYFHVLDFNNKLDVYNFYLNLFGNILLFIPFSIILIAVFKILNPVKIILYTILVSVLIETIQYIFEIGFADIDDVILNTLGAAIGIYLFKFFFQKIFFYNLKQTEYKS